MSEGINLDKNSGKDEQLSSSNPYGYAEQPPKPYYSAPEPPPTPQYQQYPQAPQQPYNGQYAQPVYNQQQYVQPGYQQNMYGLPGGRMNTFSIISFASAIGGAILSFLPFIGLIVFVSVPGAIITGHIALSQIKRTGGRGRGFALTGVIIGYLSVALFLALIAIIVVLSATCSTSSTSDFCAGFLSGVNYYRE